MKSYHEDDQDKIDALTATIADLQDQLHDANGDTEKQRSIQNRIDMKQSQIDKLRNPTKESTMKIIREAKQYSLSDLEILINQTCQAAQKMIEKEKKNERGKDFSFLFKGEPRTLEEDLALLFSKTAIMLRNSLK